MREIRWTIDASNDLENISLRIAEDSHEIAYKTVRNISQQIQLLTTFPFGGRPGREAGTRELILSPLPYIAVYRIKEEVIEILHFWHGAQSRR